MRKYLTILLLFIIAAASVPEVVAGPYDWSLSYTFKVANPLRKIIEIEAEYTFPSTADEVTFQLDDFDSHYTRGYREHIRVFNLTDSKGDKVEVASDSPGAYRASGLKGTYKAHYNVVMDHYLSQSELGIEDTPLLWGPVAVFPGASVIVYPKDLGGSRIGSIDVRFVGNDEEVFVVPYEKVGRNHYRVESLALLKSEFWSIGLFDEYVYEKNGDSLIYCIVKEGISYDPDSLKSRIDLILDFYTQMFGSLPVHRLSMSVIFTPTSAKTRGMNSFGAVGFQSFNCLLDEKVADKDLDSQMGLISYNLMSFWTPGRFRPDNSSQLDWFTTGVMNYSQLKTMLRLGFIDDNEFMDRLSRTYSAYRDQLDRRGLSLNALLKLANSNDRTVYEFMICAMLDLSLIAETGGEASLDDVLVSLYHTFRGTAGYSEADLHGLFRELGLTEVDSLMGRHFREAYPIELKELLRAFGYTSTLASAGQVDIGLRLTGPDNLSVDWVDPKGAAKKAGIQPGDILSQVRGFKIDKASDLPKLISNLDAGSKIEVTYIRNGKERDTEITLARRMIQRISPIQPLSSSAKSLWEKYKSI
ncbi:MAG: PDZ domain-containing protein [candidate division Zixibacteria bacterium]|nr:PDZ domain-containing protein [candidate division Zixibacteria bacterium]MBU1470864.1 PDZ domain-containing protein [candidate division Zixibacteria bacterium]MBU2626184.1 PDZ domain-containing protein [candidate division Zixibacteria bacterium]